MLKNITASRVNADLFRLNEVRLDGISRKAYRLHLRLMAELEQQHVELLTAA